MYSSKSHAMASSNAETYSSSVFSCLDFAQKINQQQILFHDTKCEAIHIPLWAIGGAGSGDRDVTYPGLLQRQPSLYSPFLPNDIFLCYAATMFRGPRKTEPEYLSEEVNTILQPLPVIPWGALAMVYLGVPDIGISVRTCTCDSSLLVLTSSCSFFPVHHVCGA